jgi:thioredoxin:protein disulfide reductase
MNLLSLILLIFSSNANAVGSDKFIPADKAFKVSSRALSANSVALGWEIAEDCYLYRHRFNIESLTPGIKISNSQFPPGQAKHDHQFGKVEIFKKEVNVVVGLERVDTGVSDLALKIVYQGCAESGICYMPEQKTVTVALPALSSGEQYQIPAQNGPLEVADSEQGQILLTLNNKPYWFVILSFFGFGLLLAFTPCVFPMLPIISGIIAGQGKHINSIKAFWLSLSYVMASALTYTVFGIIAGLFGSNLQAFLQTPWVIATFSAVFVVLALPMFGWFELQLPGFFQTKLAAASNNLRGGSIWSAGIMGVFSALIIGPCVTAPLAGALLYISQTGDAVLGGTALFSLGVGMGIPLLLVGTFAGKLLPKAGVWMAAVKACFGIGLLGVAIWLLSRILPAPITFTLWLLLATLPVFLLMHKRRWRLAGLTSVFYGMLLWLGLSEHFSKEIPSMVCSAVQACEASLKPSLTFTQVNSATELQAQLDRAKLLNKPVMLDFYADWCTTCVEMKHSTFTDPAVHTALADTLVLQADVSQHTDDDKALLKQFNVIGPPAILFFNPEQKELAKHRLIGFIEAKALLERLNQVHSSVRNKAAAPKAWEQAVNSDEFVR